MAIKLKLQPFSSPPSGTKNIGFVISGLEKHKIYRVVIENATADKILKPNSVINGTVVDNKILVEYTDTISGKLDLLFSEIDSVSIISIYANIEEKIDEEWKLVDIAAFAFQIEQKTTVATGDKISIYPPFVGLEEKATVTVQTKPNSNIQLLINNKRLFIKSNFQGFGSLSFRAIDILADSSISSKTLHKFPILYAKPEDKYTQTFDSGAFVHFVPQGMRALQSTNDGEVPECAILDPVPEAGISLEKADDFCVDGAVVGNLSIFNEESDFYNSKVGFCSELQQVYPSSDGSPCRIFNSTSSAILADGSALIAFSSQENFELDSEIIPTLASRVLIASLPSSLRYKGNPVRNGAVLKPPRFYHTVIPDGVAADQRYGIVFRLENGVVFEIQYTTILGTQTELITSFVELINNDLNTRTYEIKAFDRGDFIEISSDTRFSIRTNVFSGNGKLEADLNSNKTINILGDEFSIADSGDTVVFLIPKFGYQHLKIVSRDLENKLITVEVPKGFNNNIGPNILDNIYCEKFVIVDTDEELPQVDTSTISPLPYIYDVYNREVSCVYPVIAVRKIPETGEEILYIVCQAPVDGIYQLFFFSFRIGESLENTRWKQLTRKGENKNAKIKCDNLGNLHVIWESDRLGSTQIYYSVLGPSSKAINNQILMSILDKNKLTERDINLCSVSNSTTNLQGDFTRILGNGGKVSIYDRRYIAIEGNPSVDTALAYYSLSKDEFGNNFSPNFAQLSYQVSFDLWMPWLETGVLEEDDIEDRFESWKSQFSPAGEYKYKKNNNLYTLDSYEPFFENLIPICASFKLDTDNINVVAGGSAVDDVPHRMPAIYGVYNSSVSFANSSNIKHWMLAISPEKVRFKAKNTETFAQYCERNNYALSECDDFVNEIEYEINTGKYKFVLLLSTSENESTGELSKKNYTIYRLLDQYVDFTVTKNVKIGVHYSKLGEDHIAGVLSRERQSDADKFRYLADIIISFDNKVVSATSFLADFTDQYRKFDIAFGFPPGFGFERGDSIPYKGNMYESADFRQIFANISISPYTIRLNPDYIDFAEFERDTSQMVYPDISRNILSNGSFESSLIPFSTATPLLDGYESITGWTVGYGAIYRSVADFSPITEIGFNPASGQNWVELTGLSTSETIFKGYIYSTITTEVGKKYWIIFDIANQPNSYLQGSSITKKVKVTAGDGSKTFSTSITSTGPSSMNWKTVTMSFTASSTSTVLRFENVSNQFGDGRDILYGPQIDNVKVILETDLGNELNSFATYESLMIDKEEFDLNYSLNASDNFTQIPITLYGQNKNPDLYIDRIDKYHVVWQSNQDDYWDIYYSGSRLRGNPFRFDTKITNSNSSSVNPSIAVDSKGRRLIAWQDERSGINQIYSAFSKTEDDMFGDSCKKDEVDEFLYRWNSTLDPYYDAGVAPVSQLDCLIEFNFLASENNLFHFNINFYEDKDYTVLYKKISSRQNLNGWKINKNQMSYNGLSASEGVEYSISYTPSSEDSITGKVLYVLIEYETNSTAIDIANSVNIDNINAYSGLDLRSGKFENTDNVRVITEFENESPVAISPQSVEDINFGNFTGTIFQSPLTELPGVEIGQKVRSFLLHFDPSGQTGSLEATVKFNSPILAVFASGIALAATNSVFGFPGVTYARTTGAGLESLDEIIISADRKTLELSLFINPAIDEIRVITLDDTVVVGEKQFVYYCPTNQSSRCDVQYSFYNNSNEDKYVNFRVSFYADPAKTNLVFSSFSKEDNLNWIASSEEFPSSGLLVRPNQTISVAYTPEVLPFELYEAQTTTSIENTNIIRQPLICGIPYRVVIESFRDNKFFVESDFEFLCPCKKTNVDFWNKDYDSSNWLSSGQGFDDIRISLTDNQCLFPKVVVSENDIFYIVWQDFRYTRIIENQPSISPDYFMAIYDANKSKYDCSGQGSYDRRLTSFEDNSKILYDASIFIDPFQNINISLHDGYRIYHQSCSLGCIFTEHITTISPCMFTDDTDSSLFVVGGDPDRTVDQYQKIRIASNEISYSTYLDLQTPIPVVSDCFIQFDIIGVPGTYAYRLKNENDEDWSEWLPIGPDLPDQSQSDNEAVEKERNFFRAYFTQKDRFIAPWVVSPGNGVKKVCCEILTFFGKTESFCIDFMALYDKLEYKIDLFFDEDFMQPIPKFNSYPVVSKNKTPSFIDDSNLTSIQESTADVSRIYVRVEFRNKQKIILLEQLRNIERFGLAKNLTMNVHQQGLNDQTNLILERISDGIYRGSFEVHSDDGILNIDGLAIITVDVPGQCTSINFDELVSRAEKIDSANLDQSVSIFNNFTLFREAYILDDIKGSFGNPDYYKRRAFGFGGSIERIEVWPGGQIGSINNDNGYNPPSPPSSPNPTTPPGSPSGGGSSGGGSTDSGGSGGSDGGGGSAGVGGDGGGASG